jgi:hypothetical protein
MPDPAKSSTSSTLEAAWLRKNLWELHAPNWERRIAKVLDAYDALVAERDLLREALRTRCKCYDPDVNQPTDWGAVAGVRIPHHCDCPLYPIELPDRLLAATAYADAVRVRDGLFHLQHTKENDD